MIIGSCDRCKHWYPLPANMAMANLKAAKGGECRRLPPLPLPMQGPNGQVNIMPMHPPTQATHVCGEFETDFMGGGAE